MKRQVEKVIKDLWKILNRPEMGVLPGQLAFFFILSLVPTLTIITEFASLLSLSMKDIEEYFNMTLDPHIMELISPVIDSPNSYFGLLVLMLVGTYIASNGTNSIIVTANNIYGIEGQSFLKRRLKAILMVFIIILLFIFILIVPICGRFLLSIIEKVTGTSGIYEMLNFVRMPFSWVVIFIFIKMLYTIAPDKHIPSKSVNNGSLFTSLGWIISTEVYLYYVKNFSNYNLYYSGLSNIAILMIWMYILATIFVIGLAINSQTETKS